MSLAMPHHQSDMLPASAGVRRSAGHATASHGGFVDSEVVNWYLIALALIYVVWSLVHLPSSIWARSLLACYLIWRMKPDIILPFMLSGVQLRLQLSDAAGQLDTSDLASQLTGYEQYAFAVPCVFYAVRTFVAALSARAARRDVFPFWLYGLYLCGMPFVLAGALSANREAGWTTGVRCYCLISMYFYGHLLPRCSPRQMGRLLTGFAICGFVFVTASLLAKFGSRQLWILLPLSGCLAPMLVFRGFPLGKTLAAIAYSVVGGIFGLQATFTIMLQWLWGMGAGICLGPLRSPASRRAVAWWLAFSLFVTCPALMLYGAFSHDPSLDLLAVSKENATTSDYINYKLFSDRGPIWWGAIRQLVDDPTICGTPAPKYIIHTHGKDVIWPYSTHNIILDPLLRLGPVAGSILLLVLVHACLVARNAMGNSAELAVAPLAVMVVSNILLGGATLPYVLNDRESEHLLMTAGLLGLYGGREAAGAFLARRPLVPPLRSPAVRSSVA